MAWEDWFRIPATAYRAFVQNIWPAALIVFAVNLIPRSSRARWQGQWYRNLVLVLRSGPSDPSGCLVRKSMHSLFKLFCPALQGSGTNLISGGFGLVTLLSFLLSRGHGAISGLLTTAAVSGLYWPIRFTAGTWFIDKAPMTQFVDSFHPHTRFVPNVPNTFASHTFVVATFAATSILITLLFSFRALGKRLVISFALLLPVTLFLLSFLHSGWVALLWFGSPFFALQCLLVCAGLGLLGVCRYADTVDGGGPRCG